VERSIVKRRRVPYMCHKVLGMFPSVFERQVEIAARFIGVQEDFDCPDKMNELSKSINTRNRGSPKFFDVDIWCVSKWN